LEIIELLADVIDTNEDRSNVYAHSEYLVSTIFEILREADERDDPELIRRIINIQDRFLSMGLHGIEDLYQRTC
jgi:hypothetical protein